MSHSFYFLNPFLCFRNLVYNLSVSDLREQQRLSWYSSEPDVKMCVMKGKDEVSKKASFFYHAIEFLYTVYIRKWVSIFVN